jgi:hypothetical protein
LLKGLDRFVVVGSRFYGFLRRSINEVPILRRVDVLRVLRAIFFESVVEQVVFVITKSLLRR